MAVDWKVLVITIWLYTECARAISRAQISQKSATNFGTFTKTSSVCANINSVCTSWAPWIHDFLGNFRFAFPKKVIGFWKKSSSPQSVYHWANPRTVGGSIPLGPSRRPASYCPCLPSFCAIVSVLFLTRTSARLPACCTRLLPHILSLLP